MDAVKAFNAEVSSMLDMKPPISRAKMMSITKAGIKAIKLYKHVVQIIEKFISKCNPELKVPGLYMVDSIIRQSRLQFGEDKDVFGPRFLKNLTATFQNLYECPPDDKEKILRVLSLWQKNSVFGMDVIQPLVDMASAPVLPVLESSGHAAPAACASDPPEAPEPQNPVDQLQNEAALTAIAQFLQSTQVVDLQRILQTVQQSGTSQPGAFNVSAHAAQDNCSISRVLPNMYEDQFQTNESTPEATPASSINYPDLQHAQLLSQRLSQPDVAMTENHEHVPQTLVEPQAESGRSRRDDGESRYSGRSRSRSPSRRLSSRSGSYSRQRYRHSRSHSRERRRSSPRPRRQDKKEAERRLKGLPPIKRETLSVCSTTLWLGQLDKKTQQQDVGSVMEEFGQIQSINMIPPRGCAYIVLLHREDAYTALNKLSRGSARINRKPFKIAWAMNKGVSSRYKKYWDVDLGVTYIPWEKLRESEIAALKEGAVFDGETLKPEWAALLAELSKPAADTGGGPEREQEDGAAVTPQVPAVIQESSVQVRNSLPADQVMLPSENPDEPKNQTGPGTVTDPQPSLMPPVPSNLPPPNLPPPSMKPTDLTPPSVLPTDLTPPSVPPTDLTPPSVPPTDLAPPSVPPTDLAPPSLPPTILTPSRPKLFANLLPTSMPRPSFPRPRFSRTIFPRPSLPPPSLPRPSLPRPNVSRGPMFRYRMPIPGPNGERFPIPGPMDTQHWNGGDYRNDWQDEGPEWFCPEPPFRPGGWNRGGPRSGPWFRN